MKKHERARILADAFSDLVYKERHVTQAIEELFLKWINTHDVPTYREIQNAMKGEK